MQHVPQRSDWLTLDLEKRIPEDPDRWKRQWRRERRQMFWEIVNSGLGYGLVFIAVYDGAELATLTAAEVGRVVVAGAVWYALLWLTCRWYVESHCRSARRRRAVRP
jgi:hypothetical protein